MHGLKWELSGSLDYFLIQLFSIYNKLATSRYPEANAEASLQCAIHVAN